MPSTTTWIRSGAGSSTAAASRCTGFCRGSRSSASDRSRRALGRGVRRHRARRHPPELGTLGSATAGAVAASRQWDDHRGDRRRRQRRDVPVRADLVAPDAPLAAAARPRARPLLEARTAAAHRADPLLRPAAELARAAPAFEAREAHLVLDPAGAPCIRRGAQRRSCSPRTSSIPRSRRSGGHDRVRVRSPRTTTTPICGRSRFGVTTKKSGWDCMRHYELAASGCVPCFRDLEEKPAMAGRTGWMRPTACRIRTLAS